MALILRSARSGCLLSLERINQYHGRIKISAATSLISKICYFLLPHLSYLELFSSFLLFLGGIFAWDTWNVGRSEVEIHISS